ncbi:MAG: GNAT family N-acetyltransferase [Candidatus Omnitrophota bacterium]
MVYQEKRAIFLTRTRLRPRRLKDSPEWPAGAYLPKEQIHSLINGAFERFYLEGIKSISGKEIRSYHINKILGNSKDLDFVLVYSEDGALLGMGVFQTLKWDTKCLRRKITRIDLVVTRDKVSRRRNIYKLIIDNILDCCWNRGDKVIFFRYSSRNKLLNGVLNSMGIRPLSAVTHLYYRCKKDGRACNDDENLDIEARSPRRSEHKRLEAIMVDGYSNRLLNEPIFRKSDVRKLYGEWIKNNLNGRVKEVLLAAKGKDILGFVAFDTFRAGKKKIGFIDMIVVDKKFRGMGVGALLMRAAAKRLSKDVEGIFLGTESGKKETVNFYRKLGFRVTDTSHSYHIKPIGFKC